MAQSSAEALQALLDKQAISETLLRYSRAIDRRDADLMRRVYWPDAIDDHAVFTGNVEEFIAYSFPFMEGVVSQHIVTNIARFVRPFSCTPQCGRAKDSRSLFKETDFPQLGHFITGTSSF